MHVKSLFNRAVFHPLEVRSAVLEGRYFDRSVLSEAEISRADNAKPAETANIVRRAAAQAAMEAEEKLSELCGPGYQVRHRRAAHRVTICAGRGRSMALNLRTSTYTCVGSIDLAAAAVAAQFTTPVQLPSDQHLRMCTGVILPDEHLLDGRIGVLQGLKDTAEGWKLGPKNDSWLEFTDGKGRVLRARYEGRAITMRGSAPPAVLQMAVRVLQGLHHG